jgi:rare lipoprotein A
MKTALISVLFILAAMIDCRAQTIGLASYYNYPRVGGLVAAHRTLPFGAHVKVTNLGNGRSATVVIVDRGPFVRDRIIDVSTPAADVLAFRTEGVARVKIEVVDR